MITDKYYIVYISTKIDVEIIFILLLYLLICNVIRHKQVF